MRKCSTVSARFGNNTYCIRTINPLFGGHGKSICSGLISKLLEFEGFKLRIMQAFPQPEKLQNVPAAHPVLNNSGRIVTFVSSNVGKR